MTKNINYNQYLRDNPMPTKPLNKKGYHIIEYSCECERIDEKGDVE